MWHNYALGEQLTAGSLFLSLTQPFACFCIHPLSLHDGAPLRVSQCTAGHGSTGGPGGVGPVRGRVGSTAGLPGSPRVMRTTAYAINTTMEMDAAALVVRLEQALFILRLGSADSCSSSLFRLDNSPARLSTVPKFTVATSPAGSPVMPTAEFRKVDLLAGGSGSTLTPDR